MDLTGIINIASKGGLFKIISRNKNIIIVESLIDKKRLPVYPNMQANMLEEIGIYTYDDTKPLVEIFDTIAKKENGKKTISHKSSTNELSSYFRDILPEYDEDRVYMSDIKKIIQWYNIMQSVNLIPIPKKKKQKKK